MTEKEKCRFVCLDNTELGRQFSSFSLNSTTLTNIAGKNSFSKLLFILQLLF